MGILIFVAGVVTGVVCSPFLKALWNVVVAIYNNSKEKDNNETK